MFQNAVRTALGLGVARLVAGSLDLSHGFWVLLAVLTLGRTTAGATWSAVRSAVLGTFAGALTAGALIPGAGETTDVYAALLAPMMLLAFTMGPVAGVAWAQGLFTLVVSTAFAQLAPVTWRLGETRVVDVFTGCCIGLLFGVLAWPAGAATEVRRGMARLLLEAAPLVPATAAATLPARPAAAAPALTQPPGDSERTRWRTRHRLRLAEAAYAQYRSEPGTHDESAPDWPAALNFAIHDLVGADWLPQIAARDLHGEVPDAAARWAREAAASTADAAARAAAFPAGGVQVPPVRVPYAVESALTGPVLPVLVDVENWLVTLRADLRAIGDDTSPPSPARRPSAPEPAARP